MEGRRVKERREERVRGEVVREGEGMYEGTEVLVQVKGQSTVEDEGRLEGGGKDTAR